MHQFALRLLRELVDPDHGASRVISRLGLGYDADIARAEPLPVTVSLCRTPSSSATEVQTGCAPIENAV